MLTEKRFWIDVATFAVGVMLLVSVSVPFAWAQKYDTAEGIGSESAKYCGSITACAEVGSCVGSGSGSVKYTATKSTGTCESTIFTPSSSKCTTFKKYYCAEGRQYADKKCANDTNGILVVRSDGCFE